ncbi:hypothetical protein MNBD_ALPHA06-1965 [hydrothermal vent metagenome]|uniref:Molybdopterin synthase sulfur carrier subunit n=1 Tax=hydrothermal vent metagenome TaxID=652676 RepID=A0A3B0S8J5_9ZZZZ
MKITVQMFGAFRALGNELELEFAQAVSIKTVRDSLQSRVAGMDLDELLNLSKFANEREVLRDAYICKPGEHLAILPPVSGG